MEKFVGANVLSAAVLVVGITLPSSSANQKKLINSLPTSSE